MLNVTGLECESHTLGRRTHRRRNAYRGAENGGPKLLVRTCLVEFTRLSPRNFIQLLPKIFLRLEGSQCRVRENDTHIPYIERASVGSMGPSVVNITPWRVQRGYYVAEWGGSNSRKDLQKRPREHGQFKARLASGPGLSKHWMGNVNGKDSENIYRSIVIWRWACLSRVVGPPCFSGSMPQKEQ